MFEYVSALVILVFTLPGSFGRAIGQNASEPTNSVLSLARVPEAQAESLPKPIRTVKGGLDEVKLYTERLPSSQNVVIKPFSATDSDLVNGEKKDETKTLQADGPRLLADRFVSRLKELGSFPEVSSDPAGSVSPGSLLVEGKFVELDPGSRAKRYLVGMGAGKSAVAVEGSVKSADGTLLATFRQKRVGVMGMGGGDSIGKLSSDTKSIGEDLAKFLSDWSKGTLK
jgi:hypothetical protein